MDRNNTLMLCKNKKIFTWVKFEIVQIDSMFTSHAAIPDISAKPKIIDQINGVHVNVVVQI